MAWNEIRIRLRYPGNETGIRLRYPGNETALRSGDEIVQYTIKV